MSAVIFTSAIWYFIKLYLKTASHLKEITNVRSCVPNIICFQTQKQLSKLNNIRVLLKSVLNDLRARNFVHARNRARSLSSPAPDTF